MINKADSQSLAVKAILSVEKLNIEMGINKKELQLSENDYKIVLKYMNARIKQVEEMK